jgi:hypothetical protein
MKASANALVGDVGGGWPPPTRGYGSNRSYVPDFFAVWADDPEPFAAQTRIRCTFAAEEGRDRTA